MNVLSFLTPENDRHHPTEEVATARIPVVDFAEGFLSVVVNATFGEPAQPAPAAVPEESAEPVSEAQNAPAPRITETPESQSETSVEQPAGEGARPNLHLINNPEPETPTSDQAEMARIARENLQLIHGEASTQNQTPSQIVESLGEDYESAA